MWEGKAQNPPHDAEPEEAADPVDNDDDDFGDDFDEFAEEGGDDDDFGDFDEADAEDEQTPMQPAAEVQTVHRSLAGLVSSHSITSAVFLDALTYCSTTTVS